MADIYVYRPITNVDYTRVATIRNGFRCHLMETGPDWAAGDLDLFTQWWPATQVAVLNGQVVGAMGSWDWNMPGCEAVVAQVNWPWVDATLGGNPRLQTLRYLLQGVVKQLRACRSARGVVPTFMDLWWPLSYPIATNILTNVGATLGGQATQDGVPVAQEVRFDLVALGAALDAAGVH